MHVEAAFLGLVGVCCVLACIIPGTELWLACRPIREDYKPFRHPGVLAFLLAVLAFMLGYDLWRFSVLRHAAPLENLLPSLPTLPVFPDSSILLDYAPRECVTAASPAVIKFPRLCRLFTLTQEIPRDHFTCRYKSTFLTFCSLQFPAIAM